ncbi:chromate transporter [Peribacillus alkalitolerans]|uniref:chromate transporter n=1 Tax=Peribacillus alkalitolerans TaxID=1550385 RepID=UPI0013D009C1|nr:chromate transporter [Peribacillus alkalitolerans]
MKWKDLFFAFFRVGMLGYGGGPSSIPLVKKEVVERYAWMEEEEFSDTLALANTLPGPIGTKLAGYIGYRVKGLSGMFIALLASVLPTVLIMIFFLSLISNYKEKSWVTGMTQAIIPVVGAMLIAMTWEFVDKSASTLGWVKALLLMGISLVCIEILHIPVPVFVLAVLLIALLLPVGKKERDAASVQEERT